MRRGRVFILLALILFAIAFAAYMVITRLGGAEVPNGTGSEDPQAVRNANIVIAAQDIARGAVIPADGVILSPIHSDMIVQTMTTDIGQVVGRRARMDIARGVPITENMVTDQAGDLLGTGSEASIAIPPGFTAIAVPMNRLSGVAYAVQDGDLVDILISMLVVDLDAEFQAISPNKSVVLIGEDGGVLSGFVGESFSTDGVVYNAGYGEGLPFGRAFADPTTGELLYAIPSEDQRPRLLTQRLVERATVLHVGDFDLADTPTPAQPVQDADPNAEAVVVQIAPPDVVTLIVSPQDALAVNYAIKAGVDIILTLRGPDDFTEFETSTVSLQYLFDNYNFAVPSKLPYGLNPRQDGIVGSVLPQSRSAPSE
jgi:Flp pilus assembly protein CpaB